MNYQQRLSRARSMITTCKTERQIKSALKWVELLCKRFGGFSIKDFEELFMLAGMKLEQAKYVNFVVEDKGPCGACGETLGNFDCNKCRPF